jgi:hypothetical protein
MDKEQLLEREEKILSLIRAFCNEKLNDEYYELAEKMVKKLGRKRSQPLTSGKLEIWAAAVIHAIGITNFLFKKSTPTLYITVDELNDYFGTKKTTTTTRSKEIRDMLKLRYFDKEFSLKTLLVLSPIERHIMTFMSF